MSADYEINVRVLLLYRWQQCQGKGSGTADSSRQRCGCLLGGSARREASRQWSAYTKWRTYAKPPSHTHISTEMPVNVENPYVIWFTHSLLQQLLQAVDVWSVPSLPLHHHTVSARRKCGYRQQPVSLARHKEWRQGKRLTFPKITSYTITSYTSSVHCKNNHWVRPAVSPRFKYLC